MELSRKHSPTLMSIMWVSSALCVVRNDFFEYCILNRTFDPELKHRVVDDVPNHYSLFSSDFYSNIIEKCFQFMYISNCLTFHILRKLFYFEGQETKTRHGGKLLPKVQTFKQIQLTQ